MTVYVLFLALSRRETWLVSRHRHGSCACVWCNVFVYVMSL